MKYVSINLVSYANVSPSMTNTVYLCILGEMVVNVRDTFMGHYILLPDM